MASVHQKQPLAKVAVSCLIDVVVGFMTGLFFLAEIDLSQPGNMPTSQKMSGDKMPSRGSRKFCITTINKKSGIRFTSRAWKLGFVNRFDLFYTLNSNLL